MIRPRDLVESAHVDEYEEAAADEVERAELRNTEIVNAMRRG